MSTEALELADLVRASGNTIVLTGAGLSVPSGIPDFRTPQTGLWANVDPMKIAHVDVWRSDPQRFWSFYAQRFASLGPVKPNGGHYALSKLQEAGVIGPILTQNIDMLHTKSGAQDVIELHGSIAKSNCLSCGSQVGVDALLELVSESVDGVPRCVSCRSVYKPGVVLFGDMLPELALRRASDLAKVADLLICVGSSLEVYPVAGLPLETLRGGGRLALVTQGPTPFDHDADLKLVGDVELELQALAQQLLE